MDEDNRNRPQKSVQKRSLTPNRALFDSYGEAHRTIAGCPVSPYETYDHDDEFPSQPHTNEEVVLDNAGGTGKSIDPNPDDDSVVDDPFGGFATNSDHSISEFYDAFETDRKYSFLRGPAEREVSSALRQVTGISQPSSGQLLRYPENRSLSIPAFDPAQFASRLREEKAKEADRNKQPVSFYNSSAINSAWHMSENEIKVPTSPPPTQSSDVGTPEPQEAWTQIDLKDGNDSPWNAAPATSSVFDHVQDWVTVSDEQQDGARRPPGVFMGRVLTGSSIANYSDHLLATKKPETSLTYDPRAIHPNLMPWWDKLPSAGMASQASRHGLASSQHAPRPILAMSQGTHQKGPLSDIGVDRALSKLSATRRQSKYERFDSQEGFEMQPLHTQERPKSRKLFSWGRAPAVTPPSQAEGDNSMAPLVAARPLSNYDNLHFPLVALKDAQRIQAHRRASGLEDQATSGSFVSYKPMVSRGERRNTALTTPPRAFVRVSSFYSSGPLSPNMHDGDTARSSYYSNPLRRNPAMFSGNTFQGENIGVPRCSSGRNTLLLTGRLLRPRLTTRSMTRRYQEGTDPELGRLAGRDSDFIPHQPLPLSLTAQKRQELFFLLTVIINVPLPFWGVAVLYGKMDSAVSWCTKGEAYGLAERHRG